MRQMHRVHIPAFVRRDLATILGQFPTGLVHYGLFGSILHKTIYEVGDIDVLWIYAGLSFDEIIQELANTKLALPFVCSYMNYSSKISPPPNSSPYYHFVFMPKQKPDREFLSRHDGRILYLSFPFEDWRKTRAPALAV